MLRTLNTALSATRTLDVARVKFERAKRQAKFAAAFGVSAFVLGIPALVFLLAAAYFALRRVLPPDLSALVVAAVLLAIIGVLYIAMKPPAVPVPPTRTERSPLSTPAGLPFGVAGGSVWGTLAALGLGVVVGLTSRGAKKKD